MRDAIERMSKVNGDQTVADVKLVLNKLDEIMEVVDDILKGQKEELCISWQQDRLREIKEIIGV